MLIVSKEGGFVLKPYIVKLEIAHVNLASNQFLRSNKRNIYSNESPVARIREGFKKSANLGFWLNLR